MIIPKRNNIKIIIPGNVHNGSVNPSTTLFITNRIKIGKAGTINDTYLCSDVIVLIV